MLSLGYHELNYCWSIAQPIKCSLLLYPARHKTLSLSYALCFAALLFYLLIPKIYWWIFNKNILQCPNQTQSMAYGRFGVIGRIAQPNAEGGYRSVIVVVIVRHPVAEGGSVSATTRNGGSVTAISVRVSCRYGWFRKKYQLFDPSYEIKSHKFMFAT